jgi:hypothetical protein
VISKGRFFDSILLLTPGGLTALGFFAISASRVEGLDGDVAASFLVFVPWTILGLVVAKFGLDIWILSRGSQWPGQSIPLATAVISRMLPTAAVACVALGFVFSPVAGLAGGVSIVADAMAMIVACEMSAQGRVRQAAIAHFLRYPLFFVLLVIVADTEMRDDVGIYMAFMISALARLGYLLLLRPSNRADPQPGPRSGQLAFQQILNYGLFKNDQLAFLGVTTESAIARQVLVYLARFPELVSAAIVSLGPILYPGAHRRIDMTVPSIRRTAWVLFAVGFLVLCIAGAVFRAVAPVGLAIPWTPVLAVVTHAALVFPVNLRTYQLFFRGQERGLIAGLAKANSVGVGLALSILWFLQDEPNVLLWIVPVQHIVFLLTTRSNGRRSEVR